MTQFFPRDQTFGEFGNFGHADKPVDLRPLSVSPFVRARISHHRTPAEE
jgi:hypothetical protein